MAKRKRTNVQHAQNASVAPPRKAAKPAEQKAENKQGKKQQQNQKQEQKQKQSTAPAPAPAPATATPIPSSKKSTKSHGIISPISIQVVTGSYERSLHGITATITPNETGTDFSTQFTDTFLFQAHASAVRCLALSPVPTAS
ncbi:hypothetical protein KEM55_007964 [Ascosphaera atra]|nr:hypothetical protein KEM55_007964 [Ascosphaera atra]